MKLLKMAKDTCLIHSAAMVLDVAPETILEEIGHDGEQVWWPDLIGSKRKRSFHMQEILDCFIRRNKGLMLVEAYPKIAPDYEHTPICIWSDALSVDRFFNLIRDRPAILVGHVGSMGHACAWSGSRIYDPNGFICKPGETDYRILEAWVLVNL
jgi:hypothetical protein